MKKRKTFTGWIEPDDLEKVMGTKEWGEWRKAKNLHHYAPLRFLWAAKGWQWDREENPVKVRVTVEVVE